MQSPFQVPPVPSFVFILFSKLARIGAFILGGKPATVVTVFPPRPLFSLLTSKRSPCPISPSFPTSFGFGFPDDKLLGKDTGNPSLLSESKGDCPKSSRETRGSFPSLRDFLLILRKRPFQALHPPARARLSHSFCSPKNASVSGVIQTSDPLPLHPVDRATPLVLQVARIPDSLSPTSNF